MEVSVKLCVDFELKGGYNILMFNETSLSNTILASKASLKCSEKFANLGQLLKILLQ